MERNCARLLAAVAILAALGTGCAGGHFTPSVYTERMAGATTDELLQLYEDWSGRHFHFLSQVKIILSGRIAVKTELELRGYDCNPTGCYLPR